MCPKKKDAPDRATRDFYEGIISVTAQSAVEACFRLSERVRKLAETPAQSPARPA
jgi:hypothetical protein